VEVSSPSQVVPDWKQTQQREMGCRCDELAKLLQPYDTQLLTESNIPKQDGLIPGVGVSLRIRDS
jgi:hypothetical protein